MIGRTLSHYQIVDQLGAGGMGVVYLARDTKLNRDVALKVLPELFAADPDRVARFEREAQAVAALSHPNILGIFDFDRDGDTAFAVTELLEGETLRDRIAAGPLPPRRAIEYAVQIANGLAAAHGKGIAHRDLKPENLFITREERVKILDFGLAKPLDLGGVSATIADTVGTAAGMVMGTVGYMAPEQVRGLATDHRADIFSFGTVLYEMLTGRRAFTGDTPADTITAILNTEPQDLQDALGGSIPPSLDRIVRRCLEKKPELRFQSAQDLSFALDTLTHRTSGTSAVAATSPLARARGRRTSVLVGVAVLAVAAAGAWLLMTPGPQAALAQHFTAITDAAGEEVAPSISPDGSTIAYASRARGSWDVYVQRAGGRQPLAIAADPERAEASPAFSPNGELVAFHESDGDGGIFVVGATGESSRRITDTGFHPAWSPDGAFIAFTTEEIEAPATRLGTSALWVVSAGGGAPRKIEGTGDAAQASWSPSGERLVYWSNTGGQRDIYTVAATGGERVPVVEDDALDWCPVWAPDGKSIYFASDRGGAMNLWRIGIDQRSGRTTGRAEPVTAGVSAAIEMPSISRDGQRLVFRSRTYAVNPVSIPFDPAGLRAGTPLPISNANTILLPSDISPDGRLLAYQSLDSQEDILVGGLDGSDLRRITDDAARDRRPVWTPDGRSLVFYSNRDGQFEVWRVGRDGGNRQKIGGTPDENVVYPLLSPQGDRVAVTLPGNRQVAIGSMTAPFNLRTLDGTMMTAGPLYALSWSGDGSKLAGVIVGQGGPTGVAVYDLASGAARVVSDDAARAVRWLSDSRRVLYFTLQSQLVVVDTSTLQRTVIDVRLPLPPASVSMFALSRDDRTIIYGGQRAESDIWIMENR